MTALLEVQDMSVTLKLAEEPADCLALLGHSELEKLTTLLEDLYLLEVPC